MATYRVPVLEDFAWQPPVEDIVANVPIPSDVSQGIRYLVSATGSDQFNGEDNNVATCTVSDPSAPSDWMFDTPVEGHFVYVKDENALYKFGGATWTKESIDAIQSRALLLESEMSQAQSRVLVLESEMSQQISDLLVEKSTVNDVSEAVSQTQSRALVLESEMSQAQSRVLVLESEMSQSQSRILVLESEMSAVQLTASRVLVLESEMSAVEADKQDLGTYVAAYGAIQFTV